MRFRGASSNNGANAPAARPTFLFNHKDVPMLRVIAFVVVLICAGCQSNRAIKVEPRGSLFVESDSSRPHAVRYGVRVEF